MWDPSRQNLPRQKFQVVCVCVRVFVFVRVYVCVCARVHMWHSLSVQSSLGLGSPW